MKEAWLHANDILHIFPAHTAKMITDLEKKKMELGHFNREV